MMWKMVQLSAKTGFCARSSLRSWKRRMVCPSAVVSTRVIQSRAVASATMLWRALAMRSIRALRPS